LPGQGNHIYVGHVVDAIIQPLEIEKTSISKYFLGGYSMNGKVCVELIRDLSGVSLPMIHFPDFFVSLASYILSGLAQYLKPPPWCGLSFNASRTISKGFHFDGSLAEKELNLQ
jgi:hypothetical protein